MQSGNTFTSRRQKFERLGVRPYRYSTGREVRRFRLRSRCSECGATYCFEVAPSFIPMGKIQRRCNDCRDPFTPPTRTRAERLERWRMRTRPIRL